MDDFLKKMPIPYEPMKKNRWLVKFSEPFSEIQMWWINKASRPTYTLESKSWDNMVISLVDPIGQSTSKIILDAIRELGKDSSKSNIKFALEMLDPTGVMVETWVIEGDLILVDFGELSYDLDESCEIKLHISPRNVELKFK